MDIEPRLHSDLERVRQGVVNSPPRLAESDVDMETAIHRTELLQGGIHELKQRELGAGDLVDDELKALNKRMRARLENAGMSYVENELNPASQSIVITSRTDAWRRQ
jgi:hypothetical protein